MPRIPQSNAARTRTCGSRAAATTVAVCLAMTVARTEPRRRATATALARRLAAGLGTPPPAACVVPLVVGEPDAALRAAAALADAGVLVPAIRPPSVPPGTARLRFATTAAHTPADVDAVVAAVASQRVAARG